jgi:hypothetical protein
MKGRGSSKRMKLDLLIWQSEVDYDVRYVFAKSVFYIRGWTVTMYKDIMVTHTQRDGKFSFSLQPYFTSS